MNHKYKLSSSGVDKTIFKNTSSNVLMFASNVLRTLIITPVFLHALGNYDYGIWEIVVSILGYLGLLDIGLRPALTRFVARVSPTKQKEQWQKIYSTGFYLFVSLGVVVGSILFIFSILNPESLFADTSDISRYVLFMQLIAFRSFISFPRVALESVLEGGQKYILKNNVVLLHSVFSSCAIYFCIEIWDPLLFVTLLSTFVALSKLIFFIFLVGKMSIVFAFPLLRNCDFNIVKELYRFGFKSFVQGAAFVAESRTDVIIIASMLGPSFIVFYTIPKALTGHVRGLIFSLTTALMPAFSQLDSVGEKAKMKSLFLDGSRVLYGCVVFLSFGVFFLGSTFISLWLGPEYSENCLLVIYALSVYLFISLQIPLGTRYLSALNRHGILAKIGLVRLALNLLLSFVLVRPFGPTGVALGSLLASLTLMPVQTKATLKAIDVSLRTYVKNVLFPSLFPAFGMAFVLGFCVYSGLFVGWFGFFVQVFVSTFIYWMLFCFCGLSLDDRFKLRQYFLRT